MQGSGRRSEDAAANLAVFRAEGDAVAVVAAAAKFAEALAVITAVNLIQRFCDGVPQVFHSSGALYFDNDADTSGTRSGRKNNVGISVTAFRVRGEVLYPISGTGKERSEEAVIVVLCRCP